MVFPWSTPPDSGNGEAQLARLPESVGQNLPLDGKAGYSESDLSESDPWRESNFSDLHFSGSGFTQSIQFENFIANSIKNWKVFFHRWSCPSVSWTWHFWVRDKRVRARKGESSASLLPGERSYFSVDWTGHVKSVVVFFKATPWRDCGMVSGTGCNS